MPRKTREDFERERQNQALFDLSRSKQGGGETAGVESSEGEIELNLGPNGEVKSRFITASNSKLFFLLVIVITCLLIYFFDV